MDPEGNLKRLGLELPAPPKAMATYRPWTRVGNVLYVAGQGPMKDGKVACAGKVGADVTTAQAKEAARLTCLNALAVVRDAAGSLGAVRQVLQATVWVNSAPSFQEHPLVADGATELLQQVFGEQGLPARAAVGAPSLPMDIAVELALVVELR